MATQKRNGLCECGCGRATTIYKGQPRRFVSGHNGRKHTPQYEVVEAGYVTPCWLWLWGKNPKGYALVDHEGRKVLAHRLFYERERGPIPAGLTLDHLCRNHGCVNADHLESVTSAVNVQRGDGAKLTVEAVREIRGSDDSPAELARRFGVGARHVRRVRNGTGWKQVAA